MNQQSKVAAANNQANFLAETHEVINQPTALESYNIFTSDQALGEFCARFGADWAETELTSVGALLGQPDTIALGDLANRHPPEFDSHDRFGRRIDLVRFHPAYHSLMQSAISHGLHASPWLAPRPGAHVARAAKFYMQSQIEAGHGCPITMTFASRETLRLQPDLADRWEPGITSLDYDPRNIPAAEKRGLTIGMAMTEKQGGSDVRANRTRAIASGAGGPGQEYQLVGHKYFVSAPMCDAFLSLAQTERGLSCFLLPRWRPDGSKNPLQIQRLKRKMGNVSNASCETELRGALAWMVGEEGRGVKNIIAMVALTRFDCMLGSAAGMRAATAQALHHGQQRRSFGRRLDEHQLMQNVLADLALESEASLLMALRMAHALDHPEDEHEALLVRLCTALGKYWICKRSIAHAAEAMECIGGSGFMEDGPMPRLLRESPVNAIWEGSGNIQCLDMLRSIEKTPQVLEAFFREVALACGADPAFDRHLAALQNDFARVQDAEYQARDLADRMALALQASLLLRHAPDFIARSFCRARLEGGGPHHYGALPYGIPCARIIERAAPNRLNATDRESLGAST